jgi:hypothetical protein
VVLSLSAWLCDYLMSKLSNHILAHKTDRRVAVHDKSDLISVDSTFKPNFPVGTVYRIEAIIGIQSVIPDDGRVKTDIIVNSAKRRIVEEIFGEFRIPLLELKSLLYQGNCEEANKIVNNIMASMFEI